MLTDDKHAAIGLPSPPVGLLPGAGGTQRLPRLVGVETAMPRFSKTMNSSAKPPSRRLAHAVVKSGEELAAAEEWLRSSPSPVQPWDREDWVSPASADVCTALAPARRAILKTSLGHYPALFAILDCVEHGLPQSFEGGIRSEMTSFSHLVLRPEPRAMIQTMFLGRVDYERLERKQQLPDLVEMTVAAVRAVLSDAKGEADALTAAGFKGSAVADVVRERVQPGYWIEDDDARAAHALAVLKRIHDAVFTAVRGAHR